MSKTETTYVQGGADFRVKGRKTKTALKEAIKADSSKVYLYDTSAFGSKFSSPASDLPEGVVFNVVGPDPFTRRDWYASVYRNTKGVVAVK